MRMASSLLCSCQNCTTFLCEDCLAVHQAQLPTVPHHILRQGASAELLQKKVDQYLAGKEELLANITALDRCVEEFCRSVDDSIAFLVKYREDFLKQMREWKRQFQSEIEIAVPEVEESLMQEAPKLGNPLSKALWNATQGSLALFKYNITPPSFPELMQQWVETENLLSDLMVVEVDQHPIAVLPTRIVLFDTNAETWKPLVQLSEEISIDGSCSSVFIGENKIFICGGGEGHGVTFPTAYIVDNGNVMAVANMNSARRLACLAYDAKACSVYVFGGVTQVKKKPDAMLKSAEGFILKTQKWTSLGDMSEPRLCITACWVDSIIYLCGGGPKTIETFTPSTGHFTVHKTQLLPDEFASSPCLTVRDGTELVMISETLRVRMNLHSRSFSLAPKHGSIRYPRSQSYPFVKGKVVYFVDLGKAQSCRKVDLLTGEPLKEFSIA